MQQLPVCWLAMRGGWVAVLMLCVGSGCAEPTLPLRRFLQSPDSRRERLQSALFSQDNEYARLRLSHYGLTSEGGWLRLPVFAPLTAVILADGSAGAREASLEPSLPLPGEDDAEESALRAALWSIGRRAFFHYPAQLVSGFDRVRTETSVARDYGLWTGAIPTGEEQLGGLLEVSLPDGSQRLATTCATCHAAPEDRTGIAAGAANASLDLGKLGADASGQIEGPPLRWGMGRLDTSPDGVDNPAAIPDLRIVSSQRFLHHDATLRNDLFALALRIETLLITTYQEGVRPPIEVALGLAVYVWDLASIQSSPGLGKGAGETLFAQHCARCHLPPHYSGEPVALSTIVTDPALGLSTERGTGHYRTPSLLGARTRQQFFHQGALSSVRAVLDPERFLDSYREGKHGPGPVLGHPFGIALPAVERAALTTFVESL